MARSFSRKSRRSASRNPRILITGAAGRIGQCLAASLGKRHPLRLLVRTFDARARRLERWGEVRAVDLADAAALKAACRGCGTVIHLAGDPRPAAKWDALLSANIMGTYQLFAAASSAGCRKVIVASSIHAVSGYPADVQIKTDDPVNPGDFYGVSKCFVEALARFYAERRGLNVLVLRIGAFQPLSAARKAESTEMMDAFLSPDDLVHLMECCLRDTRLRFAILHALSNNRFKRLDLSDTRELVGFRPRHDLTRENPRLRKLHLNQKVKSHSQADRKRKNP